jgi:predicted transcriptional regulator
VKVNRLTRKRSTSPKDMALHVIGLRRRLSFGAYRRIAQQLGVSPAMVSQVASGKKRSRRIEDALIRAMRKMEREIERAVENFDKEPAA